MIGVDVEKIRPLNDSAQMAARYFSPHEVGELRRIPRQHKPAAFFACWTRKEAYVKARGHGLSLPLDNFHVPVHPSAATNWRPVHSQDSSPWYVLALQTPGTYAGALAAPVADLNVCYWECLPKGSPNGGTEWITMEPKIAVNL